MSVIGGLPFAGVRPSRLVPFGNGSMTNDARCEILTTPHLRASGTISSKEETVTEPRGFDLDGETSRAWAAFVRRLADHLADMGAGDTLALGLGSATDDRLGVPVVVFTVSADGLLHREECSADAGVLEHRAVPCRDADKMAAETVGLLRDVRGVMHPAFLLVSGEPALTYVTTEPGSSAAHPGADVPAFTEPLDSAHLLELAFRTIAGDPGPVPVRDADGDIVVETKTTRLIIRVLDDTPVIQIFGRLVHDVANPFAAPAVVANLNLDHPFAKFLFVDDSVLACVHLPAIPFVPAHLRHMLATFADLVDGLSEGLVRRLGGPPELGEPPEGEPALAERLAAVPPELLTLVRLDPEGRGLEAEATARICGYDQALARQLLHIAGGQEDVWRAAAEQHADDPGQESRCIEEANGWQATRRSLAGALEVIDALEA